MLRHVSTRLVGGICGPIWWPVGEVCGKPLNLDLRREAGPFVCPPSLRELLLHVDMRHGGDFQGSRFTADTEIVVAFYDTARRRHVERRRNLADLPVSYDVADLISADAYSCDFCNAED